MINEMTNKKRTTQTLLKALIVTVIFSLALLNQKADAQQMFVDDAEVTTYRSVQAETWYGSRESWFLTAISPIRGLELGTGIGFDSRDGFDPANWILEAKFVPFDLEADGWSAGIASGLLFDFDGNVEEVFAYIPFTKAILQESSFLHLNAGFEAVSETDWEYEFIKGIRFDLGISERVMILSEFAGANFDDYFYQAGFRFSLIPDLLEMDITYGEGFRRMETAPGFNVGIAFTPDRLW